ncbi:MAG: AraC-like DNA-binding protein/mannose-6-phosphate isomerase-like protein (cupin superfamily) [Glaciecola sp.]|jgi:AraC-like DNA-binding protein/mannose-6-phosphate isomerase-like protein (cupin superfamily)
MSRSPRATSAPRIELSSLIAPGVRGHIARVVLEAGRPPARHGHDYAELFWVDEGSGWHLVNGDRLPLAAGTMVFVRPEDEHTFRTRDRIAMYNLAFGRETLDFLQDRYFDGSTGPWSGVGPPVTSHLEPAQRVRLREAVAVLVSAPIDQLALDRFLLAVLHDRMRAAPLEDGTPHWLHNAIDALSRDEAALAEGGAGLARLAGRTPEHVNRVLRQHTGLTTTETVNAMRLDRAAGLLCMTDAPILDVAVLAGFGNLSHFYACFGARFGTTPRRYRLGQHQTVAGPDTSR